MDLLLEIISHQRHAMPEEQSKFVFKAAGGTIGRNQDNDWPIDDPERLISGQHAAIHFEKNHFIILDHSTNGLFINQNVDALGEQQHRIINGDIFLIGQYSIQATLISTQSQAVFSSSASMHSANQASYQDGSQFDSQTNAHQPAIPLLSGLQDSGLQDSGLQNSGLANENSISLLSHEQPQNLNQLVDPMNQFNDDSMPGRLADQDILSQHDPVNSILDPIPSTQSYFDLPNAIPENWLNNRGGNSGVEGKREKNHNESSVPVQAFDVVVDIQEHEKPSLVDSINPEKDTNTETETIPSNKSTELVGNFDDFKKDFQSDSTQRAKDSDEKVDSVVQEKIKPDVSISNPMATKAVIQDFAKNEPVQYESVIPDKVSIAPSANNNSLKNIPHTPSEKNALNVLLETIGINPDDISDEQLPELTKNIALIAKHSMSGTMKTMISRAHLKNEFRMSMTTIKTQENNPLKFCISYEQLVHYMLVKPMSGYLDAEQAVKESFEELQEHQIGVMAGMKSSLNYMLEKLSPERIIEKSDRVKSIALGSKKSRYWDAYNELHEDINDEEDIFSTFFGNEFCKAYERQINDIRQAKK